MTKILKYFQIFAERRLDTTKILKYFQIFAERRLDTTNMSREGLVVLRSSFKQLGSSINFVSQINTIH